MFNEDLWVRCFRSSDPAVGKSNATLYLIDPVRYFISTGAVLYCYLQTPAPIKLAIDGEGYSVCLNLC